MKAAPVTALILFAFTAGCALITPTGRFDTPVVATSIPLDLDTLRANATLVIENRDLKATAIIHVKMPDLVRIDMQGAFGRTVALLIGDGSGELRLYTSGDAEEAAPTGFKDTAALYTLRARDLAAILVGARPARGASDEKYAVETGPDGLISRIVKSDGARTLLRVKLGDFRNVSETLIPFRIEIENNTERLVIQYKAVYINEALRSDLFTPPDY